MGSSPRMWLLSTVTLFTTLALAQARCPDSWWNFGNSCYHNSGAAMNWHDARKYCLGIGGYLVEIDSEEEETALLGAFAVYDQDYWIGLTDASVEGEWIWADTGKPPKYTAWAEGEPNDMGEQRTVPCCSISTRMIPWTGHCGSMQTVMPPTCPTLASTLSTPSVSSSSKQCLLQNNKRSLNC